MLSQVLDVFLWDLELEINLGVISIKTVFKVTRGWAHLGVGGNRNARTDPSGSAMWRGWREKSGGTGKED